MPIPDAWRPARPIPPERVAAILGRLSAENDAAFGARDTADDSSHPRLTIDRRQHGEAIDRIAKEPAALSVVVERA